MAKPKSLAVGNILTLTLCRYGSRPAGTQEWCWKETTTHRYLGKPRAIMAARSEYVEVGEERAVLTYPKKTEYVESDGKITLAYTELGNGNLDVVTELTYEVKTP